MIKIKESTKPITKISAIKYGWLERALRRRDAIGRRGIDLFDDHGIMIVHGNEKADVGLSMHGDPVQGIPFNKCIILKGEPPIYNIYFGQSLNKPKYLNQFLAIMSNSHIDDVEYTPFMSPQPFCENDTPYSDVYFDRPKDRLITMVLRNKKLSKRLNSIHPTLRKYNKFSNLDIRIKEDKILCKNLGPKKYWSFGLNGNWSRNCFHGAVPTHNQINPTYDNLYEEISRYKFNFAPENSRFKGYVTEKPLQAMICGSIPIYLGAPDVEKYLPKNTYIDYDFYHGRELCEYIEGMSETLYNKYRTKMKEFITSKQADAFSSHTFAQKLINIIGEKI